VASYYLEHGQLTVGLEVGQEAVGNLEEFSKQIEYLKSTEAKFLTMGQFGKYYTNTYPGLVDNINIGDWKLTQQGRENDKLKQKINYQPNASFGDYFVADEGDFLERDLQKVNNKSEKYYPYWLLIMGVVMVLAVIKKWRWWGFGVLIIINTYGLVLKSSYQLGWKVFYGTEVENLIMAQAGVMLVGVVMVYVFRNYNKWWLAGFGLVPIISAVRYSVINGEKYLGTVAGLRFNGIKIGEEGLGLVAKELPGTIAGSFLQFPWERVWQSPILGLIIYPTVMLALGLGLFWLQKMTSKKWVGVIWWILMIFMVVNVWQIIISDPRVVKPQ